ncbi:farnesol dehydrogenase-like [Photinus pyralis]|uniref:Dehydrogenase/reductase SDR family member 11 n=1 Tax=Photinus pyralis TaxID=7054 RepID=A0A1Y1LY18_PHOPY|nr:farnesol dehydrogenase-like [Photinus pyralis]XP_031345887.1 farnesol dehydrogenase-like [Photinus pyralis]XP_031345888.1 farnesol dehydrogenase-like [Photinus pyralis]
MVLSIERWVGKVAIVTGASSGVGAEVVKSLLKENIIVVGLARRTEKIRELSSSKNLHAVKVDLSVEDDILRAFKWVKENLGPIHILINCAGILRLTDYLEGDTKMWKDMMDVNYHAVCITTREAVKDMRANGVNGHIIHINDVGGYKVLDIKHLNVYCATKFPVTAAVEGLRLELNAIGSKIKVSCINPGYVKTDLFKNAIIADSSLQNFADEFENENPALEPSDIADGIIYLLSTAENVQVRELTIKPIGEEF